MRWINADVKVILFAEDPEKLIELVEKLSDEELEKETPKLLGDHPNTYTITKHMAEHEILKLEGRVPCAIVRPSMSKAIRFPFSVLFYSVVVL